MLQPKLLPLKNNSYNKLRVFGRSLFVSATAIVCIWATTSLSSATETSKPQFPFLGQVNTNNVNVRSGQSVNFEKIGQLFKGEKIAVYEEADGWYKIRLPRTENFVSAQFVRERGKGAGEISGDRVNVRSSANTDAAILYQLDRGTAIHVIEIKDGWCRFESVNDAYGWVSKEFVDFQTVDISAVEQGLIFTSKDSIPVEKKEVVVAQTVMKFTGTLARQDMGEFKDVPFKLVNDDTPVCFVTGPATLVDDFLRYKVEVEGIVFQDESKQYPFPVVHVKKIQLIL